VTLSDAHRRKPRGVALVAFVLRLFGCLAVSAATAGLYAAWEAAPAGAARIWLLGASVLAVPLLLVAAEVASNPVLDYLETRSWWAKAGSAARIAAGVLATLPVLAVIVVSLALFRKTFGVEP
jgi:hypothetical protein